MIVPKKTGIVFVTIGAVLILSALLLFFYNQNEDERAGQEAQTILNDVQAVIDQRETEEPEPSTVPTVSTEPEESEPPELTVVMDTNISAILLSLIWNWNCRSWPTGIMSA